MSASPLDRPLLVVVGAGGVGKTTLAAGLGVAAARAGADTLVMTFDPSLRLKDALGVGDAAREAAVPVPLDAPGRLDAGLLDARATFDRLVRRHAPDAAAARRILDNRFYRELAGQLAGILEYMAVERLFEITEAGGYDRVILDTPPTQQAIDFLEAPGRIMAFLDSGVLRLALPSWLGAGGMLRAPRAARGVMALLDRVVGLGLLRDMIEFFQAFTPLYEGFHRRAEAVRRLLVASETGFLLVAGPGRARVPETLLFARRLREVGHHVVGVVVNQAHSPLPAAPAPDPALEDGVALLRWLGARDAAGLAELRGLLAAGPPVAELPLRAVPPTALSDLAALGEALRAEWKTP